LKNRHTDRKDRQFTSAAMKELKEYSWPGNVRELENAVERAFFLSSSTFIDSPVLEQKEILHPHTLSSKELDPSEIKENIHQITFSSSDEKHILFQIMEKTGGNVSTAAKLLGIGKTTLYTMLIRVGIRASDFRKKKKFKIFETKI
jgi:DNA-binding NtrC family response regulator